MKSRYTMEQAFATGYASLAVWSDLLDRINVFPVADGDTGTNLRISLASLRDLESDRASVIEQLGRSAVGNSGNIAAAFFREFVQAQSPKELAAQAMLGRDRAWRAVAGPRRGTMLSVFEALAVVLEPDGDERERFGYRDIEKELRQAVLDGAQFLPELERAGVVDAGALAMFIFFDGFFRQLEGADACVPVQALFVGKLSVNNDFQLEKSDSFCVDALLRSVKGGGIEDLVSAFGDSVVMLEESGCLKVHVHTRNPGQLRSRISDVTEVVAWSDGPIENGEVGRLSKPETGRGVHLVTDSAGSLTRKLAREHGLSLLDSYILADGISRPESLWAPDQLYQLMRAGLRVSTAQASTVQRHQHYAAIQSQYEQALYLCVGSAFTGNYDTVMAWKKEHDPDDRLDVLDTGAASGRLGLIALLTARYADPGTDTEAVIAYARQLIAGCREYIFIDELHYLAAGGRVSKTGGFLGDLLHLKPILSPGPDGVKKVGVARSRRGQLDFALEKLTDPALRVDGTVLMLQYTDNEEWVIGTVQPQVQKMLPAAEIFCLPLSLTAGVHMGPGTWSLAVAPGN